MVEDDPQLNCPRPTTLRVIWLIIKAPVAVQLYRLLFATCFAGFSSYLWTYRFACSVQGWLAIGGIIFPSLLGFIFTCIRAPHSRWILAGLGILIPISLFTGTCFLEFSRPEAWWDLLLSLLLPVTWLCMLVTWGLFLFKHQKTNDYFTRS